MKKSVQLALLILIALVAYFGIRTLTHDGDEVETAEASVLTVQTTAREDRRPEVIVTRVNAEQHPIFLDLKGRTAANRTVTVRAATTGTVISTPAVEGSTVGRGALLCRLNVDSREARLAESEALVESRRVDYEAAAELAEKGWSSPNRAASAKASLDAAEAALNSARIELSRTRITAPFSGIFESRMAETGDFLSTGGACGVVTDLDPIRIEADVTEAFATQLQQGAPIRVDIAGAPTQEGSIAYVSRTADTNTRTFRIEAELPNPDARIPAGLTSNLRVQIGEALATPISSALLTLHDDGRVGVRMVDDTDTVRFAPVEIVDDTGTAIWVTGLPEQVDLLTVGQDFVKDGTVITRIDAATVALP